MYTPTESTEFPGWFIIPSEPRYLANKTGQLLNRRTKHILKGTKAPVGYMVMNLYNRLLKKDITTYMHRLICETFHGPPIGNKNHVNHKDGIKTNNYYTNLEWVTSKENWEHAIDTGLSILRWINKEVLVWDVLKNEIKKHPSIEVVKKEYPLLCTAIGSVPKKLKCRKPLFKGRYYIAPVEMENNLPKLVNLRKNMILVTSLSTGNRYLIKSHEDAAHLINAKNSAIGMSLKSTGWCNGFIVSKPDIELDLLGNKLRYSVKYRWKVNIENREFIAVDTSVSPNRVFFTLGLKQTMRVLECSEEKIYQMLFNQCLGDVKENTLKLMYKEEATLLGSNDAVLLPNS